MHTTTKWTLVALSAVAVVGVGAAATGTEAGQEATDGMREHFAALHRGGGGHGAGGHDPWRAVELLCDDTMTVGECKEILHSTVHEALHEKYQECLESHSQDYCDGRVDQWKAEHPRFADP